MFNQLFKPSNQLFNYDHLLNKKHMHLLSRRRLKLEPEGGGHDSGQIFELLQTVEFFSLFHEFTKVHEQEVCRCALNVKCALCVST